MFFGIPLHCFKPMERMGRVKIGGHWYTQWKCTKCGEVKNTRG